MALAQKPTTEFLKGSTYLGGSDPISMDHIYT